MPKKLQKPFLTKGLPNSKENEGFAWVFSRMNK